jgi:multidrug efflux pump subunit AcrB
MLPLLLDPFFKSLAATFIFGLSFATILTLILLPVLYLIVFRVSPPEGQIPAAPRI